MNTYPEMNKQIVGLLRVAGTNYELYAAARIEELEAALETGQRNCDEVYEDLRTQRDEAQKDLKAIREMVSRFLIAHRDTHRCWIESFVECGAIEADFNYHPNFPFIKPKGEP